MSLEVDGRPGGVPIAHQSEGEGFKYINSQDTYGTPSSAQDPYAAGTTEQHIRPQQFSEPKLLGQAGRVRVRPASAFRWGVLSALVSVLAIVATGVAGSVAAKRAKQIDTCMNTLQKLNATLNASDSSDSNNPSGTDNPTGTANTTCQNTNAASFMATSDCTSLSSPYTPPTSIIGATTSNNSFNIHCDTDYIYAPADFMSFLAFTFEDCIVACASYNQRVPTLHPDSTCYGVTFDSDGGENRGPSCFLKGMQNLVPTSRPGISSSALLITD